MVPKYPVPSGPLLSPDATPDPIVLRPPLQPCVEGFVFVRSPFRLLLLKRTAMRGGFWQSVSGRVEPSDPSLEAAVRREVREETQFTKVGPVIDLHWEYVFEGRHHRPWKVHAFGVEVPDARPPVISSEHEAYRWCRSGEALATLFWPDNREALRRLLAVVGR
ncbi:MAG: NUDIX domain-containing protein [Thermoplasmata archaeon]|nr:NUDIX domain-containing protein [Thermoplasmata archaeon]